MYIETYSKGNFLTTKEQWIASIEKTARKEAHISSISQDRQKALEVIVMLWKEIPPSNLTEEKRNIHTEKYNYYYFTLKE